MFRINYLKTVLVAIIIAFSFFSCSSDDDNGGYVLPTDEVKTGELTQNETWTADRIYQIQGKLIVPDGITLTIQPGTIIKGKEGDGTNASALVVARGGKLMAEGTAENPIIFTSILDNIEVGQKTGTNLDESDSGKWGGVIILGKAKVSVKIGDTEGHIEGIDADALYGKYGGDNDADNSGVIKYVSIRHGGISIGNGNEINGLTLGGVGTGTLIDNVEVVANLDDGIECFGGSVDINHALVSYQGDDAFDIDQNYSGKFINSMVVYKSSVGDEFLEIDGPENTTYSTGKFTIENCLFRDKDNAGSCDLKSKAQGFIQNNEFESLNEFKVNIKLDTDCSTLIYDAYDNYIDAQLVIKDNKTDAPLILYTASVDVNDNTCDVPIANNNSAQLIYSSAGNTITATPTIVQESDFSWSWTAQNNKL